MAEILKTFLKADEFFTQKGYYSNKSSILHLLVNSKFYEIWFIAKNISASDCSCGRSKVKNDTFLPVNIEN